VQKHTLIRTRPYMTNAAHVCVYVHRSTPSYAHGHIHD